MINRSKVSKAGMAFLFLFAMFFFSSSKVNALATCDPGYYFYGHLHDCKKNCTNDRATDNSWYWINATYGANCGTGIDGAPKYWCDVDECDVDIQTNPLNCGSIGYVCPAGNMCVRGQCIISPTPLPTPFPNPWDVNRDRAVNIVDIGLIIDNYLLTPIPDPRTDVDHDGSVSIVDIGLVIDHYGLIY